ncbi:unnamed protein product [Lampetra planeri]
MSAFLSRPLGPGSSWTPGSGSWPGPTVGASPPPPDELLAAAVGDVAWMELSLAKAGSLLREDGHGLTALHVAALHCRLGCLRRLLERHGVEVELASATGWRALHLACNARRGGRRALVCVRYLLARGARVNACNEDSVTPLHVASSEGLLGCVRALLEAGADPSARDLRQHRPVELARLWGHRKCTRLLASVMWMDEKNEAATEDVELLKMGRHLLAEEKQHFAKCERANRYAAVPLRARARTQDEREFVNAMSFLGWLEDKRLPAPPAPPLAPPIPDSCRRRGGHVRSRGPQRREEQGVRMPGGGLSETTAPAARRPRDTPGRITGARLQPGTNLLCTGSVTARGVAAAADALPTLTPREPWNVSTNPSSAPRTDIARPPGGAPGVWPDDDGDDGDDDNDDDEATSKPGNERRRTGGKLCPGSRRRFRTFVLDRVAEEAERDEVRGDDDEDDDNGGGGGCGRRAEAVHRALQGRGRRVPASRLRGPRDFTARESVMELPRKRGPRDASRLRGEVAMHLCQTAQSALFLGTWSERRDV